MLRFICVCAFLFFGLADAQVIGFENCPKVDVVDDFDAGQYTGLWYEYKRYPLIFEFLGKCVTATYTAESDGNIGVFNEQVNTVFGNTQEINGTASFDGPKNVAKLTVNFPSFFGAKGSYWVLGTDYKNYSVVWSCTHIGLINFTSAWILTREAEPSQATIDKINEVIAKNKIATQHFTTTNQKNCPNRA